ncbi:DUF6542 domain-containing protein [Streptomyces sp. 150FB]|uniref:DUF6542 domain-containing protein n=1 Tax=Streptomyces sp. 150FB TaxID=1576605 RepID=UPI0007C78FA9|nr:DUF6542 domain-containing protein [Streptomyces sp. 150FB]
MEQHRTRPPQRRQQPQAPLAQAGAAAQASGASRFSLTSAGRGAQVASGPRGLPNPRLTGLGAGLFAMATMVGIGFLDQLLLDGEPVVYAVLFLFVSALTALWVRTADLVTAPISVPIAFACGTVPIAAGSGGLGGQAMAVVTSLAMHAGWLYGGTLIAGLIASVRKVRQMGRRQRARDLAAARGATAAKALRRG